MTVRAGVTWIVREWNTAGEMQREEVISHPDLIVRRYPYAEWKWNKKGNLDGYIDKRLKYTGTQVRELRDD